MFFYEFGMRTLFYHLSTVNNNYLIGILYSGKTVRHHHYGTTLIKVIQIYALYV